MKLTNFSASFLILSLLSLSTTTFSQQSVGIGTDSPNPKSVLQLVSPTQNQGFLLPKLTTTQVTSLGGTLNTGDRGLMVYDSLLNQIRYWNGTAWLTVSTGTSLGTVTSVGLSLPTIFTITGSPVTTSGTLTGTLNNQTANTIFAGPTTGANAVPTFRALVANDIPNLDASKITSGTLPVARGGTGAGTAADARTNLGLNSMALQNATAVTISGGTISGLTSPLGVGSGGTGTNSVTLNGVAYGGVGLINYTAAGTSGQILQVNGSGQPEFVNANALGWGLTGNIITNANTNYIGTSNAQDFRIRTSNQNRVAITSGGDVGIGTISPTAKLHVIANGQQNPDVNGLYVFNPTNTSGQDAIIAAKVGGSLGGDPFISLDILGELGFCLGLDNSDGNKFKLSNSWNNLANNTRMTIDAAGNVGIGTSTPTQLLDVAGNIRFSGALMPNNQSGTAGQVLTSNGSGSAPTWQNSGGSGWSLTGNAITLANKLGSTNGIPLTLITNNIDRMTIDGDGNVGIGTSSPDMSLEILRESVGLIDVPFGARVFSNNFNSSPDLVLFRGRGTSASPTAVASGDEIGNIHFQGQFGNLSSNRQLGAVISVFAEGAWSNSATPSNIRFRTAGTTGSLTERMRISADGNVGIGTTAPSSKLHIMGTTSGANRASGTLLDINTTTTDNNAYLRFSQDGTSLQDPFFVGVDFDNGIGELWTQNNLSIRFGTNNSERLRISSTGNVGIGTTAPLGKLHVENADWNISPLYLSSTAANAGATIRFTNPATGNRTYDIIGSTGTGASTGVGFFGIWDNTSGAYRLVINPNGRVGIGTISPGVPLDISSANTAIFLSGGTTSFNSFNGPTLSTGNTTPQVAVRAAGAFLSVGSGTNGGFYVTSDERIKAKVGQSDSKMDLTTLRKINITDYKYIDSLSSNNAVVKGVFAQQVEEVYPQAVSKQTNFIPNIYALALELAYDESKQTLKVTMNKPLELVVGDKVKLISKSSGEKPCIVTAVAGNSFTVSDWTEQSDKVFVYGKEVQDFRIVDYDRLFTLNLSATQELFKMLEEQGKMMDDMRAKAMESNSRISILEANVSTLEKEKAELQKLKMEIERIKSALGIDTTEAKK